MRTNDHHVQRWMSRILGALFFMALFSVASDCQAQRHRGWFARSGNQNMRQPTNVPRHDANVNRFSQRSSSQILAGPVRPQTARFNENYEAFPKFIGGFHSSHFTDLGVPHGDLGFRGNSLYWTPW